MRAWATLESCSGCPAPPCRYASAVFSINLRLLRWGGGVAQQRTRKGAHGVPPLPHTLRADSRSAAAPSHPAPTVNTLWRRDYLCLIPRTWARSLPARQRAGLFKQLLPSRPGASGTRTT